LQGILSFFEGMSGIKLHTMTQSKIELILMKNVLFSMNFDNKTQKFYNIDWRMKKKVNCSDKFSHSLIKMVASIGEKLKIHSSIACIADLKRVIWHVIQLQNGITDLRKGINKIKKNLIASTQPSLYKLILNVLPCADQESGGIYLELVVLRDIEYSDKEIIMKSQLMTTSIFHFEIGYPFLNLKPTVSVVLNRQIYQTNVGKFKSMRDRSEQMLIEKLVSNIVRNKLERLQTGANQFLRCVDAIREEMEKILKNETNCRHAHRIYIAQSQ